MVPYEKEIKNEEYCCQECWYEHIEVWKAVRRLMPGLEYEYVKEIREMLEARKKRLGIE